MTERTCRTCAHCKVRSINCNHGRRVDGCARHLVSCGYAWFSGRRCSDGMDWTPAPWHRRVVARIVTAMERVGWLR